MPQTIDFTTHEEYKHLLETTNPRTIEWIKDQNASFTTEYVNTPLFQRLESEILDILNSKDKLHYPYIYSANGNIYNFLQDDIHTLGLLRRTTLAEYQLEETVWEEVFNLDHLPDEDKWTALLEPKNKPTDQKKKLVIQRL